MNYGQRATAVIVMIMTGIVTGCEREMIVEKPVEKQHAWSIMNEFNYFDRTQQNSYADSAYLYLINQFSFTAATPPYSGGLVVGALLRLEAPYLKRMPLCSKYFAVASGSDVMISSTREPLMYGASVWLSMERIDPNFIEFTFPSRRRSDAIAVNGENSLLIPYLRKDTAYTKYAALLVNISVNTRSSVWEVDTVSTKVIPFRYIDGPHGVYHFYDHYFFSGYSTYRISPDGSSSVCYPAPIYNMFINGGYLYGMSNGNVLRSSDTGKNWEAIGTIPYSYESLIYRTIDGEIIADDFDRIYHITMNDSVNTIEQLENDGLKGHFITSLSRYRDHVYATTLSGVFSRPLKDFYTRRSGLQKASPFYSPRSTAFKN